MPRTSSSQVTLTAGLIVLVVLAAYANSFSGPFVFDDIPSIRENATIRDWHAIADVLSPPLQTTVAGRPLVNASFAVSYALSGMQPWGYHAINLVIHAATALAVFGLVRRALLGPRLRDRFGHAALPVAATVALISALHPVQTESVTYIVQRAESLMGLCYVLTLYCFARAVEFHPQALVIAQAADRSRAMRSARIWFGAAVASCAAGMASKEVMVSAPLLVLLFDRTFVAGSFREAWRLRWRWHLGLMATWLLLAALVVGAGGNRGGSIGFGVGVGWWAHAQTQFPAVAHYLRLFAWPHPLVFEYEPEWAGNLLTVAPAVVVVLSLLGGTIFALRRGSPFGFLGVWFFAVLAPTSLLPAPNQFIVEHRMYLPVVILACAAVVMVFRCAGHRALRAIMAGVLALGVLTHRRNSDYRTELSLWADTVAKRPKNALARGSLANALSRAGRIEEAITEGHEAVRLDPDKTYLHFDLGVALAKAGRHVESLDEYATAVRLQPDYADAHNNYAVALSRAGRFEEAQREFEATLRLRPNDAEVHYNLGSMLVQLGRADEAIGHLADAVGLRSNYPEAFIQWGTALALSGRLSEALARYEEAVRLDPQNTMARNKRGLVLLMMGRVPDAIAAFQDVLRINPNDEEARSNLAMARARLEGGIRR